MARLTVEVKEVLDHPQPLECGQFLSELLLDFATGRDGGVLAEFDMASKRSLIDVAE